MRHLLTYGDLYIGLDTTGDGRRRNTRVGLPLLRLTREMLIEMQTDTVPCDHLGIQHLVDLLHNRLRGGHARQ